MLLSAPNIDERTADQITKTSRLLVPFYVAEWNAQENQGVGFALLQNFAQLLFDVIQHLNLTPTKNFIAFLDRLGINLQPPRSARVPVTFLLAPGTPQNVLIPARTQAAAEATETRPAVVFETEQNLLATTAMLQAVYSAYPSNDTIFEHLSNLKNPEGSQLFEGTNLQEHSIYFAHSELFNLKTKAKIQIKFVISASELTKTDFTNGLSWEWWNKDHWVPSTVSAIDNPLLVNDRIEIAQNGRQVVTITLTKEFTTEFTKSKVNGIETLWIRCRTLKSLALKDSPLRNLSIDTIQVSTSSDPEIDPEALFYNDVPLDIPDLSKKTSIYPFGTRPRTFDTFYIASNDAFSKKRGSITLNFDITLGGTATVPVRQVQGIGATFASKLQNTGINTVEKLLEKTPEQLAGILGTSKTRALNILEAAQKEFYDKTGIFKPLAEVAAAVPMEDLILSWEYWDGNGWKALTQVTDLTNKLRISGTVQFTCPEDIATTAVNGQENHWIRIRIINGDYGKEIFTVDSTPSDDSSTVQTVHTDTSHIHPPMIKSLKIGYSSAFKNLEKCFTSNNLGFTDQTQNAQSAGTLFQPFQPPEEDQPTFYLGFDKPLVGGPIGVFFSLSKPEYLAETKPRLRWEYWNGSTWTLLDVLDDTDNLTRSGLLQVVGSTDFKAQAKFGKSLFWIRAVDVEKSFDLPQQENPGPSSSSPELLASPAIAGFSYLARIARLVGVSLSGIPGILRRPALASFSPMSIGRTASVLTEPSSALTSCPEKPCPELLELFHPEFSVSTALKQFPPPPILQDIFPNTVWALQAETIRDEILGSSDGRADQKYILMRKPVVSAEIWVNEFNVISEEEQKELSAQDPRQIQEVRDEKGELTQVWVRWSPVEDFLESTQTSRDYVIDRVFGIVHFGNGQEGMVPPIGADNIKTNYQFGGGTQGNVAAGTVISLKTAVAGVDKITNPEPAGGGVDPEVLNKALERGPQVIKHRNRAMASEDFEWLARQASNNIAKVKCLPTTNQQAEFETGWVTILIVPQSQEPQPSPSAELIRQVQIYLANHCPNVVSVAEKLVVAGPAYVEVSVTAEIFTTAIDLLSQVQSTAIKRVKSFLHPLTGGSEGAGWDFGCLVCLSDIIAVLEALADVDHVDHVTMQLRDPIARTTQIITGDTLFSATLPPYAMISSGEHNMVVKLQQ